MLNAVIFMRAERKKKKQKAEEENMIPGLPGVSAQRGLWITAQKEPWEACIDLA